MWVGRPRPAAAPAPLQTGDDLDELEHLIETADPRDPQTLEQIAALLGQIDRSTL